MFRVASQRLAVIIMLGLLFLVVPLAKASETVPLDPNSAETESFMVYTDKEEYVVGEIVNIYVRAISIDPGQNITVSDVVVYDPFNVSVKEWHNLTIVLTDTVTPKYVGWVRAESEGSYKVSAKATGCPWFLWALWWFICRFLHPNVIPEVPVGTVVAAITLLGAVGLVLLPRKRF